MGEKKYGNFLGHSNPTEIDPAYVSRRESTEAQ